MGAFFNNLHLRNNGALTPDQVAEYVRKTYAAKGFTPVDSPDDADMYAAVLGGPNDGWISVYSEEFRFSGADDMRALASEYASAFRTDALTLLGFNSAYLLMNLVNTLDGTDAWMKIGRTSDLKLGRRVNRTAWRKKVSDYAAFSAAVTADYRCAEDALEPLCSPLSLDPAHAALDVDYLVDPESDAPMIRLYFAAPRDEKRRPPKFKWMAYSLDPLYDTRGTPIMSATVLNIGGASKGLQIVLSGSFVENDEVTFTDTIISMKGKNRGKNWLPITMEKVRAANGQWVLCWADPAFRLPAGIDVTKRENSHLVNEARTHFITFDFRAHGNKRKFLDITVSFIPTENPQEGAVSLWPWMGHPSKRACVEHHIREAERCADPNLHLPPIDPDDYDPND